MLNFSSNPFLSSFTNLYQSATEYWQDHLQRNVLFFDTLRERGNMYLEHTQSGKPPVLIFDFDIIVDGRTLERPVNYALTRIRPPEGCPTTDNNKQPFVVIDPRAGHGPGIGGFKVDSEIGIALRQGHPCYFFTFFPTPEPQQTIEDVTHAEIAFIDKVLELHPNSRKPFMIGNCQGGWALVMLATAAPEKVGPLLLAGSPLSYWAGVEGKNPMRYSGGLLGGSWLASLTGDLGHGIFDGAYLVNNFDSLNLPNTYWNKLYNLYSRIDTEGERFLGFERWWGGHYLMNKAEMEWITQNLFIGNRLSAGEITLDNGKTRLDMRNIRSPIIVFASWGDNITPPQQALNWILDIYNSTEEIMLNEQTIVYCLHDKIGHLGIFVSAGVATKQTSEIISGLDMIDMLPPGLYEAIIEDKRPDMPGVEYVEGRYVISFHPRKLDALRQLDDGRQDEKAFEVVRRLAEINQGVYDKVFSPFVRAMSSEASAKTARSLNPARMERWIYSDLNPFMWPVRVTAEQVRAARRPVAEDNPFLQAEKQVSGMIEHALQTCQDNRDAFVERLFKAIYESSWIAAALGMNNNSNTEEGEHFRSWMDQEFRKLKRSSMEHRFNRGSQLDGIVRTLLVTFGLEGFDERRFNFLRKQLQETDLKQKPTHEEFKTAAREQTFLLLLNLEKALQGIPQLITDEAMRARVLDLAHRLADTGETTPRLKQRMAILDELLKSKAPAKPVVPTHPTAANGTPASSASAGKSELVEKTAKVLAAASAKPASATKISTPATTTRTATKTATTAKKPVTRKPATPAKPAIKTKTTTN